MANTTSHSTNSQQLTILIIDDHPLLLKGTIDLVQGRFSDAEIHSAFLSNFIAFIVAMRYTISEF